MQYVKQLFSYEGRIPRLPFLLTYLAVSLVAFGYLLVLQYFVYLAQQQAIDFSFPLRMGLLGVGIVIFVLTVYANFCLYIKRIRDIGYSPWYTLLLFVPPVTLFYLLFLFIWRSKPE